MVKKRVKNGSNPPHSDLRHELAQALLAWLKTQGLQTSVAERLGWAQQDVSRLLTGQLENLPLAKLLLAWQRIGGRILWRLEPP